jgi:hypothetical protein
MHNTVAKAASYIGLTILILLSVHSTCVVNPSKPSLRCAVIINDGSIVMEGKKKRGWVSCYSGRRYTIVADERQNKLFKEWKLTDGTVEFIDSEDSSTVITILDTDNNDTIQINAQYESVTDTSGDETDKDTLTVNYRIEDSLHVPVMVIVNKNDTVRLFDVFREAGVLPELWGRKIDQCVNCEHVTDSGMLIFEKPVIVRETDSIELRLVNGSVYDVDERKKEFNFYDNYYEVSPYYGIRMRYQSDANRGCTLVVDAGENRYKKFLLYFGDQSDFSADPLAASYGEELLPIPFSADSAKTYYFHIFPAGDVVDLIDPMSVSIHKSLPVYRLLIEEGDNGSTEPCATVKAASGNTVKITALPDPGYRLSHWMIKSGTPLVCDSTSIILLLETVSGDAVIAPVFSPGVVYAVSEDSTFTFNFMDHYYEMTPDSGIRICCTTVGSESCTLNIEMTEAGSVRSLDYFGSDSTFTTIDTSIAPQREASDLRISIDGSNGGKHCFRITPAAVAYYKRNILVTIH